eukprot:1889108-Amphidinium_carterae.1
MDELLAVHTICNAFAMYPIPSFTRFRLFRFCVFPLGTGIQLLLQPHAKATRPSNNKLETPWPPSMVAESTPKPKRVLNF